MKQETEKPDKGKIRRDKRGIIRDRESAIELQKYATGLTHKKKTFEKICKCVDLDFSKIEDIKMRRLPEGVPPTQYLLVRRLYAVALRDNNAKEYIACQKCGHKMEHFVNKDKQEHNSMTAATALFDRVAPRLQSLQVDVDVHETVASATQIIIKSIVKYVPPDRRHECMIEINALFETLKNSYRKDDETEVQA